jgi:hypothetical protein
MPRAEHARAVHALCIDRATPHGPVSLTVGHADLGLFGSAAGSWQAELWAGLTPRQHACLSLLKGVEGFCWCRTLF